MLKVGAVRVVYVWGAGEQSEIYFQRDLFAAASPETVKVHSPQVPAKQGQGHTLQFCRSCAHLPDVFDKG